MSGRPVVIPSAKAVGSILGSSGYGTLQTNRTKPINQSNGRNADVPKTQRSRVLQAQQKTAANNTNRADGDRMRSTIRFIQVSIWVT